MLFSDLRNLTVLVFASISIVVVVVVVVVVVIFATVSIVVVVRVAARLLAAMDSTVNPCDDFFEFACGKWNKINIIPDDRSSYNTFSKLGDDIQGMLKGRITWISGEHPEHAER